MAGVGGAVYGGVDGVAGGRVGGGIGDWRMVGRVHKHDPTGFIRRRFESCAARC